MVDTSKATPTPWRTAEDWTVEIYGADDTLIAKFVYPDKVVDAWLTLAAVNERGALLKCEAALRTYLQAKDNVDGFSADKLLLCRTALAELEKVRQG